jgi:hypothetical protein
MYQSADRQMLFLLFPMHGHSASRLWEQQCCLDEITIVRVSVEHVPTAKRNSKPQLSSPSYSMYAFTFVVAAWPSVL